MTDNTQKYIAREVTPEELRLKGRIIKNDKFGMMASLIYDRRFTTEAAEWETTVFAGHQILKFPRFDTVRVGYLDVFGNGTSVVFFAILVPHDMVTEAVPVPEGKKKPQKMWGIEVLDVSLKSIIPGTFDVNVGASMAYEVESPAKISKFLPGKLADAAAAFLGNEVNAPNRKRTDVGYHLTISFPLMTEAFSPESSITARPVVDSDDDI